MDSVGEERASASPPPGPGIPAITTEIDDPVERKMTSEINAISSALVDDIIESAGDGANEECVMETHVALSGTPPPTIEAAGSDTEKQYKHSSADSGHGSPNAEQTNTNDDAAIVAAESAENSLNEEIAKMSLSTGLFEPPPPAVESGGDGAEGVAPLSSEEPAPPKRVGSPLISEESDSIKEALLVPHHVEDVKEPEPESPSHVSHPLPLPASVADQLVDEQYQFFREAVKATEPANDSPASPPPRPPSPVAQILAQQSDEYEKTSTVIVNEGQQQEGEDASKRAVDSASAPSQTTEVKNTGTPGSAALDAGGVEPEPVSQQSNTSSASSDRAAKSSAAARYYDAAKKRCVIA